MMYIRPFGSVGNTVNLTVGTATANVAITRAGLGTQSIRLTNIGANVIFFTLGKDNTATASLTTSVPVLPNSVETFLLPNDMSYIAAISAATGNTLYVTTGESA